MATEDWISDLVGALFDPIIVHQGGWMDMVPDWLKSAIKMERLIEIARASKEGELTGTDAEALAYLCTAAFEAPFDHDGTQIYLYLGTTVYERHRTKDSKVTFPDDVRVDSLNAQQMQDLKRLKGSIYSSRVKHRTEKERDERRAQREEEADRKKQEQPALFQL
jgi:hypothetical protein